MTTRGAWLHPLRFHREPQLHAQAGFGLPGRRARTRRSWADRVAHAHVPSVREQLSNVVDLTMKNDQAATLSSVAVSSSVTLVPSLNVAPSSSSLTSSAPLIIRQRSWAASSSL